MTLKSGIFNSVNGDRKYKAEDFASYFATFIGNGVFPNPSTGLQIMSNNNMTVALKPGRAWINGYFLVNDADYNLVVDVADGVLKRIDRVVLQLNYLNRVITPVVKKGTFASSPVAPVVQRDAQVYEIVLADIFVGNGVLSITQANITDQRLNTAVCGIVTGLLSQVDTTTIFNQYQSWFDGWSVEKQNSFNAWFQTVQNTLTGDVAGNLLVQINNSLNAKSTLIDTTIDWDTLTTVGVYKVSVSPLDATKNQPPSDINALSGQLIVTTNGTTVTQMYIPHTSSTADKPICFRSKYAASDWGPWEVLASRDWSKQLVEHFSYKTKKLNKDANGIYTTVELRRRSDNTLYCKAVFNGGTSPQYTTRTTWYYATDGVTVVKTEIDTLNYDADGEWVGEQ